MPSAPFPPQAVVSAHDMPGFGLTERPRELRKYALPYNGRLGYEVQSLAALHHKKGGADPGLLSGAAEQPAAPAAAAAAVASSQLPPLLRVLAGHSLGANCAAMQVSDRGDPLAGQQGRVRLFHLPCPQC
jgi:hypothetical protein